MFFTRSIRRKMVSILALILIMLGALSLSGISGLISYRNAVNDLDFSINRAPRQSELVAAIGLLFEPLLQSPPTRSELSAEQEADFGRRQQHAFAEKLKETRQKIQEFHRKLDEMPPDPRGGVRRTVMERLLERVYSRLDVLDEMQSGLLTPDERADCAQRLIQEVAYLQTIAEYVPDSQEGLNTTLREAREDYRSRFLLVCIASALVVVLLCMLIACGYRWIFAPLRKLHQGASRVAQGDFDYRVRLSTKDEMAELAEAFNKMTGRFQEIATDLDRQVRERSKQLVRSERLAGVGFLAAGVAHEINNPLSAIAMASESLQGRLQETMNTAEEGDSEVMQQYLEMIQREAFRCRQITTRLLDFSRGQDAQRSSNDLTAIVSDVLTMVGHMSKFRDRKIVFEHEASCFLEVNGPEIKQVVLNLTANALEAMDPGGTLEIDFVEQTDQVILNFRDDGCGMTEEVMEHLFEPFFTQKQGNKGTGLGLSISHRIVRDHGGTIEVVSDGPGQGSTFRVHLPRQAALSGSAA